MPGVDTGRHDASPVAEGIGDPVCGVVTQPASIDSNPADAHSQPRACLGIAIIRVRPDQSRWSVSCPRKNAGTRPAFDVFPESPRRNEMRRLWRADSREANLSA